MGLAYYNEFEPFAARWLENLSYAGMIAPGLIDDRDIKEVKASDITGTQAHFFAGIGVWSHALRLAGWPDDVPVWTGSCPCQPFSVAGKGEGEEDERHLWPEWRELIKKCRPAIIFGEQVVSPAGRAWFDNVSTDLEALGYAVGGADLCAAGVGAPHLRQRLFFMAYSPGQRFDRIRVRLQSRQQRQARAQAAESSEAGRMANPNSQRFQAVQHPRHHSAPGPMGDASSPGGRGDPGAVSGAQAQGDSEGREDGGVGHEPEPAGATRGFWADAEWLHCRDGKARPVEPGTFPLAHGSPGRVGKLRAYGNAIVPQVAATFIKVAMGAMLERR